MKKYWMELWPCLNSWRDEIKRVYESRNRYFFCHVSWHLLLRLMLVVILLLCTNAKRFFHGITLFTYYSSNKKRRSSHVLKHVKLNEMHLMKGNRRQSTSNKMNRNIFEINKAHPKLGNSLYHFLSNMFSICLCVYFYIRCLLFLSKAKASIYVFIYYLYL